MKLLVHRPLLLLLAVPLLLAAGPATCTLPDLDPILVPDPIPEEPQPGSQRPERPGTGREEPPRQPPKVPAGQSPRDRYPELRWHKGNLGWLEPLVFDAVRGIPLQVDQGFFNDGLRQRANMSPNHEALWRAVRYTAAVRGQGGDLRRERSQIQDWFDKQRRKGLQLDEPGGYIQQWASAAALAALAAQEDLRAHPNQAQARRTARLAAGWWRDFGAYYGRLRTADGRLLRVGARQGHRPQDSGFDGVLLDRLLGPPRTGSLHPDVRKMERKPETEWRRRGSGAWVVRELVKQGVPLDRFARSGTDAPLPRIWNRVSIDPGRWAWMPVIDGRSPARWASRYQGGRLEVHGHGSGQGTRQGRWQGGKRPAWTHGKALTTGPDAPLAPLPRVK